MTSRAFGWTLLALGFVFASAACEGIVDPDPDSVPESELIFIRVADDAPQLQGTSVSFWIKRGEEREAQLRYASYNGNGKCLLFRVPADAPLFHADGRRFEAGDSALVTITVTDTSLFRFEFDPGGLVFDPAHPAQLEVRYRWADPDHNGDGVVNEADAVIAARFGFWHQSRSGANWDRIETQRLDSIFEAHASITGFSQYALASN
jgi:hypothetical protein